MSVLHRTVHPCPEIQTKKNAFVSKQFHLTHEIMTVVGRSYSVQYTYILTYIHIHELWHIDTVTQYPRVLIEEAAAVLMHQPVTVLMVLRQRRGGSGQGCVQEPTSQYKNHITSALKINVNPTCPRQTLLAALLRLCPAFMSVVIAQV